jgi:hypothetical protein
MADNVLLQADFNQLTVRNGVIKMLANNLKDESDKDTSKSSLKESLALILKGNKVPYGPANQLLICILRSLRLVDDLDVDETFQGRSQDKDITIHSASTSETAKSDLVDRTKVNPAEQVSQPEAPKKKELCRFYARGHCTRSKDCRFDHPTICNKFKKHGSTSTDPKGCDGKCKSFHPNACRSSLQQKTCTFQECRFFHLKGTKRSTNSNSNSNQGSSRDSNWRSNQVRTPYNNQDNQHNQGRNGPRSNVESKNKFAGLDQKSKNRNPNPGSTEEKMGKESQKERALLGQTLEAIMKRLTAMESRQAPFLHPAYQPQQIQPNLSPAVPQPGTQTQFQWGSQPQWTQSQTQY